MLETVVRPITFNVLQAMREASKTGGALGAVSEREIDLLQNNIASLDQTQSPEQFKKNLDTIIEQARRSMGQMTDGFSQTYGQQIEIPSGPKRGGAEAIKQKYGLE